MPRLADKLLLIGWDAADWKIIHPLLDAGAMPALASLVEGGVMGNLATLEPILSPMLWTTIATGVRPERHGILGFMEPLPDGSGIRPVTSTSRRVRALWNLFTHAGITSQVTGWFGSHPAEPIRGVCVGDRFREALDRRGEPRAPAPGSVHPAHLLDPLSALRIRPDEFDGPELLPFVPRAREIDQETDPRLARLARILAENASIHNVATHLLAAEPWDFAAVYYDLPDHVCHVFMQYHPPQLADVSDSDFAIYGDVVANIYRYLDLTLARLLQLAGPDTTVMIVSDHGFHSDHLRPKESDWDRPGDFPVNCHRDQGIFVLKGPGIRRDELVYGATLLDVAPTVLTLFGLPVGEDMEGRVLRECFEDPPTVDTVPSWEDIEGEFGMHPPDHRVDPFDEQQAMARLVDLGYVEAPPEGAGTLVDHCTRDREYNLARSQLHARRYAEAAQGFARALEGEAVPHQVTLHLALCHLELGELALARENIERVLADETDSPRADLLMGQLLLAEGDPATALTHLQRARRGEPRLPTLPNRLGDAFLALGNPREAETAFDEALAIDPDSPVAHLGLARAHFRMGRFEAAAASALEAVGRRHWMPRAHYVLASALARCGRPAEARRAAEICLEQAPRSPLANELLATILEQGFGEVLEVAKLRSRAETLRTGSEPEIAG